MSIDRFERIRLQPGQTAHMCLAENANVTVLSGKLRVQGPRQWVSETVICPSVVLEERQARWFGTGGWVSMHAVGEAEFSVRSTRRRSRFEWLADLLRPFSVQRRAACK